jgi:hypothetical protein
MNGNSSGVWWKVSLASVRYGDPSRTSFVAATLGLPTNLGVALSSFWNLIPHQKEPENTVGTFIPT